MADIETMTDHERAHGGDAEVLPPARGLVPPGYRFSRDLIVLSDPASARAESIGALRTHLQAQHVRDRRRALTVCSPASGAGCTYVAANLAVSLGMAGVSTILIDANMRKPGIGSLIRPPAPGPGLRECLTPGGATLAEAVHSNVVPNLSVLFAGEPATNPQELLAGPEFRALIELCMRDFDLTIVDTPASNSCADARRIANVLRYAMLVARRNVTFISDMRRLADELQFDRATVIGTFLNDA